MKIPIMYSAKWKKSVYKAYILYNSNYMTVKQNDRAKFKKTPNEVSNKYPWVHFT
jgi:hypothetical protein